VPEEGAWSGCSRVLDGHFRKIKRAGGDAPVYIAAGDAHFASSAPGARAAPTRCVEKKMIAYFGSSHVKPVSEFRTTLMDYASRDRLHKVVRLCEDVVNGTTVSRREVGGLKLSRSSETNLRLTGFPDRLVNRDLNAALNIRLVGISGGRPHFLERGVAFAQNKSLVLHRRSHSRPTKSSISAVRMMCSRREVSHS
jgi:hypothetical protein